MQYILFLVLFFTLSFQGTNQVWKSYHVDIEFGEYFVSKTLDGKILIKVVQYDNDFKQLIMKYLDENGVKKTKDFKYILLCFESKNNQKKFYYQAYCDKKDKVLMRWKILPEWVNDSEILTHIFKMEKEFS